MVVIAIFRVIKAPFIDGNLSIIDCYAEAVHVFRNFVHVIKNRLVGAPVHVIEKTVHVHENCCSRVLRILKSQGGIVIADPDDRAFKQEELNEAVYCFATDILFRNFYIGVATRFARNLSVPNMQQLVVNFIFNTF